MSNIKEKIEAELKPYDTMCEHTREHLNSLISGSQNATPEEIKCVTEVLGGIVDIKKDIVEMCYKKQILEAMEDSEYGVDYDENGKFYTRMRDNKGRYMRGYSEPTMTGKMYDERMQDWKTGKMHYNESDYDRAKRMYTESKEMNPSNKSEHLMNLNKQMEAFERDMMMHKDRMSAEEKQQAYSKLTNLASEIRQ